MLKKVKKIKYKIYTKALSRFFYSIGTSTTIVPPFRYSMLSHVELGRNVSVHRGCWIQVVSDSSNQSAPTITIGNNVSIGMDVTISAVVGIHVEDFVIIARNVLISDHNHNYSGRKRQPVRCWIIVDLCNFNTQSCRIFVRLFLCQIIQDV